MDAVNFYLYCKFLIEHDSVKDGGCMTCNLREVEKRNERCKPCAMIYNSAVDKGEDSRVGISSRIEKIANITKYANIGKHHSFFYMYYPEFNFELPQHILPAIDVLGTVSNRYVVFEREAKSLRNFNRYRNFIWHIHHINGINTDDRKENLGLILNTEHTYLHKASLSDDEKLALIEVIRNRNYDLFNKKNVYWG